MNPVKYGINIRIMCTCFQIDSIKRTMTLRVHCILDESTQSDYYTDWIVDHRKINQEFAISRGYLGGGRPCNDEDDFNDREKYTPFNTLKLSHCALSSKDVPHLIGKK